MADKDETETTPTREPEYALGKLDAGGAPVAQSGESEFSGVAYQMAGQVRQNLAELRVARAHGQREREHAARKTLIALGVDVDALEAQEQKASTTGDKPVDARRQPPEGRSTTPPSQVRTQAPTSTPTEVKAPLGGSSTTGTGSGSSGAKPASQGSSTTGSGSGSSSTKPAGPSTSTPASKPTGK